jgi:arylsulfatase A-like enzyme
MEHGWLGHGTSIHPELTHVPLMIRLPGVAVTGEFDRLVGQVDLMPTVLEALGVEPPAGIEGRSLLELLDAPAGPGGRDAHLMQHWNGTYGLRVGHWMVIAGGRSTSLARLEGPRVWYQDPGRRPVAWLALATLATRDGAAEPNEAHVDEQTRRQLEALGYVLD